MLQAVLFDLDGTLLNSIPLISRTFQEVFRQMELPWNNGAVLKTIGIPLWEQCLQFGGPRAEELFNRYLDYQKKIHDRYMTAFPGTVETLSLIRGRGLKIGVVTSKRREMADRGMRYTGIDKFIDISVTKEDVQLAKPHPEPLYRALSLLGIEAREAVFAGDSFFDIQAGKAAGIATIGVTWGIAGKEELLPFEPDYLADDWNGLWDIIVNFPPNTGGEKVDTKIWGERV